MDADNRASKFSEVQNLNQNFKYKLVTTQVTMSKTNTFLWILHSKMHTNQSQTDIVKYVQYIVCGHIYVAKENGARD